MALVQIKVFGGEMPSVSPRALPATAAQQAWNILASTPEFRPLADDATAAASPTPNAKTLYRLARTAAGEFSTVMSTGWITHAGVVNYVKGQVNDDATERTYYTAGDGSFAPRVLDAAGQDRLLGVPAPTTKLTIAANETAQFTPDDKATAVTSLNEQVLTAFQAAMTPAKIGPALDSAPQYKTFPDMLYRVFMLAAPKGAITNAFTGPVADYNWALDPSLGGVYVDDVADYYYGIPIPAFAAGYTLNEAKFRTDLAALKVPGTASGSGAKDKDGNPVAPTALLTPTQIDDLVRGLGNALNPTHPDGAGPATAKLEAAVAKAKRILSNETAETGTAAVSSYYTQYAAEIDERITGLANNIFNAAVSLVATPKADGTTAAVTAVSPIFGSGAPDRTGAISNIKGAINSNYKVTPGSGGVKTLDVGAVTAYLNSGLQALANTQYENRQEILARLSQFDVRAEVQAMANWLAYGSFGTSGSRPAGADTSSRVAALKLAIQEVKSAATSLGTYYDAVRSRGKISEAVGSYSDAQSLNSLIPDTVEQIIEDRFYIATFVTDWGEESAPSPVSDSIELDQNDSATVSIEAPPPGRYITKWRLYRSNAGSQSASFQFVDELDVGTLTYTDEQRAAALGEPCPTLTWLEPPTNLRGLVGMPNGIMAGFFDNTVCFCDPYHPYAWPVEYQITTESPIVGLGVFGQTLVVGTRGRPYFISGSDSASMSAIKLDANQSCVSARSIVPVDGGVVFASPDGLCAAGPSGVKVLTSALWTREDWQKIKPESIVAVEHEGIYIFMFDAGTKRGCYALGDNKLVELQLWGSALHVDLPTDTLYFVDGSNIVAAFRGAGRRTAKWRTSLMTFEKQAPLAWAKVYGDFTAPVTLRWYADGALRHTMTFTNLEPQRLPPGRWLEHEVEIESTARATTIVFASTTQELQGV